MQKAVEWRAAPMRLLLVIDSLGSGGAQRQIAYLATGLSGRGHTVELFLYHPRYKHYLPMIERAGVRVHVYHKRSRFAPGVAFSLRRLVRQRRSDAVIAFLDTPSFYAELAAASLPQRPILVVSERSSFPNGKPTLSARLLRQGHRVADQVVVNSHHHRAALAKAFPWMSTKLATIVNGVDTCVDWQQRRSHLGGATDPLVLTAIGSIVPNKNVCGLVRAIHLVRQKHGNVVRLRWVGKRLPTKRGRRTSDEAEQLVRRYDLEHCWEWMGERSDISALLLASDALIHPSYYEGTPNVICEALACGVPVLASAVCDNGLLVRDGVSGLLFDPTEPGNIAAAIERYLGLSPGERQAMARRAREFAVATLGLERLIDNYEQLLDTLSRQRTSRLESANAMSNEC